MNYHEDEEMAFEVAVIAKKLILTDKTLYL